MFVRVLFLLTATVLMSCSPPPQASTDPKDASKDNQTDLMEPSQYYHYQLTNCTGELSNLYNNKEWDGVLNILVEDGKVRISRPQMDPSLKVGLTGSWDRSSGQLTDINGKFGIGQTEDWSLASGSLHISSEKVTGGIDGISIKHERLGGKANVACSASLIITAR